MTAAGLSAYAFDLKACSAPMDAKTPLRTPTTITVPGSMSISALSKAADRGRWSPRRRWCAAHAQPTAIGRRRRNAALTVSEEITNVAVAWCDTYEVPARREIPLPPLIDFLRRTKWYAVAVVIFAVLLSATWSLSWQVRAGLSLLALAWINASGTYRLWCSFWSGYRERASR
jgi:hypothetical protein